MPAAGRPGRLQQWWLDRSVRAKGLFVVAVPLIALGATTSASLALQFQERQVRSASRAASALVTTANQVLVDALNAETGVRGYAATGKPAYLAPYHNTLARIRADRESLREAAVTEGDSRQEQAAAPRRARRCPRWRSCARPSRRAPPPVSWVRRWRTGKRPWTGCAAR